MYNTTSRTLGIWLGFPQQLSMKREGISRFLYYLVKYLLINYPINFEIWCYDCNYTEVSEIFLELTSNRLYTNRIHIISEKSLPKYKTSRTEAFKNGLQIISDMIMHASITHWKEPYRSYKEYSNILPESKRKPHVYIVDSMAVIILLFLGFLAAVIRRITLRKIPLIIKSKKHDIIDRLSYFANIHSKADFFLIPIITLNNALYLHKNKLVFIHDLAPLVYYDHFAEEKTMNNTALNDYKKNINKFAEQGCYFCSNSDYVRRNHTLKYIDGVKEEKTGFVYVPVNIPEHISDRILSRDDILRKYPIKMDYLFYPTQIRPYKNVITLVKTLKILIDKGIKLQLILTGYLEHALKIKEYIEATSLNDYVTSTGDVPEIDLYSLHKYALATVVPTLFEGGFPWQGLEAMLMDTPAIMSKIPVTIERLKFNGFDPENCGLKLFDPENAEELASKILEIMKNRDKAVKEQQSVKNRLFSYTWTNASKLYYELFERIIEKTDGK